MCRRCGKARDCASRQRRRPRRRLRTDPNFRGDKSKAASYPFPGWGRRWPRRLRRRPGAEEKRIAAHGVGEQALIRHELGAEVELHGGELHGHGDHVRARTLDPRAEIDGEIGAESQAEIVIAIPCAPQRRRLQLHKHFRGGHREALAGAEQDRDAVPAPGIHSRRTAAKVSTLESGATSRTWR